MSDPSASELAVLQYLDALDSRGHSHHVRSSEIQAYLKNKISLPSSIYSLMEGMFKRGWVEAYENTEDSGLFRISAKGQVQLLRFPAGAIVQKSNASAVRAIVSERVPLSAVTAPASDRVVRLDHNQPDYVGISEGLAALHESVRGANDSEISDEAREQVLVELESARALWKAASLKAIQLKVGILMATESAATLLKNTAKAVAAALLVDAIKSFSKGHFGIDLDSL